MSNSLQEQLLKAGLVSKGQVSKAQAQTRKKHKQNRNRKKGQAPEVEKGSAAALAAKAAAEKVAKDRELNRAREQAKQNKAVKAQIRDLVRRHRRNDPKAELAHNFVDGKQVKRIYVTKEQQALLARGHLAIASVGERYHLIPEDIAKKLQALKPGSVILQKETGEKPAANDPYADYQVPDDLMW